MKKILLALLVVIGLQTQSQNIIAIPPATVEWHCNALAKVSEGIILLPHRFPRLSWCDSLSYTTDPGPEFLVTGNASGLSNMVDSIIWSWSACNSTTCYAATGTSVIAFPGILPTDTVKICYDAYIYYLGATYICTDCDSLVYDANSYSWILLNQNNPTTINELTLEPINDNKIYDLLGRELNEIPVGTMYIRNQKLYITK